MYNTTLVPACSVYFGTGEQIEFAVSNFYGLLSLTLYFLEAKVILFTIRFNYPFYYQFVYLSGVNTALWLAIQMKQRIIPSSIFCSFFYPRFINGSVLLWPIMFLNFTFLATQFLAVIIITINRMSVIMWPLQSEKFWLKYWKRVLFSSFVLACLYESHTFPIIVSVNFKGGRISTIFNQDQWPNLAPTPTTAILSGLCFCVVVFCTNAALISLQHRRTRMKTAEINMFWTSVAFSATTSIIMIYMIVMWIFTTDEVVIEKLFAIRGWMYDWNCLSPAWMLFITNRRIRRAIWKLFEKKHVQMINSSSITSR